MNWLSKTEVKDTSVSEEGQQHGFRVGMLLCHLQLKNYPSVFC